jgi:hypothetical protein
MQTTYASENIHANNILHFMRRNRVDSTPTIIRESVLNLYHKSTIEASRIPEDWFLADINREERF